MRPRTHTQPILGEQGIGLNAVLGKRQLLGEIGPGGMFFIHKINRAVPGGEQAHAAGQLSNAQIRGDGAGGIGGAAGGIPQLEGSIGAILQGLIDPGLIEAVGFDAGPTIGAAVDKGVVGQAVGIGAGGGLGVVILGGDTGDPTEKRVVIGPGAACPAAAACFS